MDLSVTVIGERFSAYRIISSVVCAIPLMYCHSLESANRASRSIDVCFYLLTELAEHVSSSRCPLLIVSPPLVLLLSFISSSSTLIPPDSSSLPAYARYPHKRWKLKCYTKSCPTKNISHEIKSHLHR